MTVTTSWGFKDNSTGEQWTAPPLLRFVVRDGEKALQQLHQRVYADLLYRHDAETKWLDVATETDGGG